MRLLLGRAGQLDREAGGDDAFEFHPGLGIADGPVLLIIEPYNGVGVDIFGLPDEVVQNKFPPIVLQRRAAFGMPGRAAAILPIV